MIQAVIDLGTNTFHLLLVDKNPDGTYQTLFRDSRPAKIGQSAGQEGGIGQCIISPDATDRALTVLHAFGQVLAQHQLDPADVVVFGTSAIRVARNQAEFVARVLAETGLRIRVLSGDEEAALIYRGVRASGAIPAYETALVMDIGGGSVEFILATVGANPDGSTDRVFWKQSFELGGQRLMDRFMGEAEGLTPAAVARLDTYLREQLLPLTNAVHQYRPTVLVGASGSFDTLVDLHYQEHSSTWPPAEQSAFDLPVPAFEHYYHLLLHRNRAERMALPGMIELRVDMIVVAVCLIQFVLNTYQIGQIRVSTYALKEGAVAGL